MCDSTLIIENLDILFYTLIFVIPGFIIDSIYRVCIPQEATKGESFFPRLLLFSIINFLIVYPILLWLSRNPYIHSNQGINLYVKLLIIFLVSVVIGLIISLVSNKGWIRSILQKVGIHTSHVIPTAWDYKFSKKEPRYVTVYLADGGIVFGYWGSNSFASSVRDNKDIYLEKMYDVTESSEWVEIIQNKGIWISAESIKYIEFH